MTVKNHSQTQTRNSVLCMSDRRARQRLGPAHPSLVPLAHCCQSGPRPSLWQTVPFRASSCSPLPASLLGHHRCGASPDHSGLGATAPVPVTELIPCYYSYLRPYFPPLLDWEACEPTDVVLGLSEA